MRIGTWNLNNQWTDQHRDLLRNEGCDVWLLTEVNPKAVTPEGRIADFHCHLSSEVMATKQYWAAILTRETFCALADPHAASAAGTISGVTYCATILPWAGCNKHSPGPWVGDTLEEMMKAAIDSLTSHLPKSDLVWGGDWNQNLTGGWENVGSIAGRAVLNEAIESFHLRVPTADLLHQLGPGHHTIDHIAVPSGWKVTAAARVTAEGLSDHDAYIIDVHVT